RSLLQGLRPRASPGDRSGRTGCVRPEHQGHAVTVAIVDLGCGNVGSVAHALDRLGAKYKVTHNERAIAIAHRVILPGVGAAGFAMWRIDELGLRDVLPR